MWESIQSIAPALLGAVANKRATYWASGDELCRLWYRPSVLGESHGDELSGERGVLGYALSAP